MYNKIRVTFGLGRVVSILICLDLVSYFLKFKNTFQIQDFPKYWSSTDCSFSMSFKLKGYSGIGIWLLNNLYTLQKYTKTQVLGASALVKGMGPNPAHVNFL